MNRLITFCSPLAEAMEEFVACKRMRGYDYTKQAGTLSYFDRFLAADGDRVDARGLAVNTLRRYAATTGHLQAESRRTRLASLREFSGWWQARCPGSAILPRDILPRHPCRERFFPITPRQIADLMAAATAVLPADPMRRRSVSTLIGLLYATGLRIGEALKLTPRDIAPDGSTLHVLKGKFGKERLVPLSPSTYAALTGCLAVCRQHANRGDTSPLFLAAAGAALTHGQVHGDFRRLCRHCGVWGDPPPRLHDLRHNYACRCLALWREAGMDIDALLPILATAMGHANPLSTQRYLHLDAAGLQNAAAVLNTYLANHPESRP
jgi:integrase